MQTFFQREATLSIKDVSAFFRCIVDSSGMCYMARNEITSARMMHQNIGNTTQKETSYQKEI